MGAIDLKDFKRALALASLQRIIDTDANGITEEEMVALLSDIDDVLNEGILIELEYALAKGEAYWLAKIVKQHITYNYAI